MLRAFIYVYMYLDKRHFKNIYIYLCISKLLTNKLKKVLKCSVLVILLYLKFILVLNRAKTNQTRDWPYLSQFLDFCHG